MYIAGLLDAKLHVVGVRGKCASQCCLVANVLSKKTLAVVHNEAAGCGVRCRKGLELLYISRLLEAEPHPVEGVRSKLLISRPLGAKAAELWDIARMLRC